MKSRNRRKRWKYWRFTFYHNFQNRRRTFCPKTELFSGFFDVGSERNVEISIEIVDALFKVELENKTIYF